MATTGYQLRGSDRSTNGAIPTGSSTSRTERLGRDPVTCEWLATKGQGGARDAQAALHVIQDLLLIS